MLESFATDLPKHSVHIVCADGALSTLSWIDVGFGSLQEIQRAMMAMILSIMGLQTIFSAIIISLLLLRSENENGY